MNTLVYNLSGSSIPVRDEAEALRVGYLLSDGKVDCLGSSFYYLIEEQLLNRQNEAGRLRFYAENLPIADPERGCEEFWETLEMYRESQRTKRDFSKEAVAFRFAAKKAFEAYYRLLRRWLRNSRKAEGLGPLAELLDNDALTFSPVDPKAPETNNDTFRPASYLLRLGLEAGDEESGLVHLLTHRFFTTELGRGNAAEGCVLLRLPLLVDLEPALLRQLRAELAAAGAPLRSAVDAFVATGGAPAEAAAAALAELRQAAAQLQAAIDRHPVLQHLPRVQEVQAFRMAVTDLWHQWRECGAVRAETDAVLEGYAEAARGREVPVLALRSYEPEAETAGAPATLKRIMID